MEFMVLLMKPKEGFFGGQVSRLYGATLGRHHGTLLRATTSTALFAMPSHATIVQRVRSVGSLYPLLVLFLYVQHIAPPYYGWDLVNGAGTLIISGSRDILA